MARIRVYELARQLGITSAALRAHLHEMGMEVSSASSSLDETSAATVKELLSQQLSAPSEEAEEDQGLEPITLPPSATVRDFAQILDTDVENVLEEFQRLGHAHLPNQILSPEVAKQVARGWGYRLTLEEKKPPPPTPPTPEPKKAAPKSPRIVIIEKEAQRGGERRFKPPPSSRPAVVEPEIEEEEVPAPIEEVPEEPEEPEVPEIWRPEAPPDAPSRPPVITVMGHVDHGKTTLLDYIRKSKVTDAEVGGITQHIGAYQIELDGKKITFLDTPGHEAFTAIRARGTRVTDIAVVVVAADDGLMPQTQEAIDHARAAEVPIVVAINKIDRPQANIDRVRQQFSALDLSSVEWGGETETVPICALDGTGVDTLLETLLTMADLHELKAAQDRPAAGTIIESSLDRRKGPVATLIVQEGILKVGDALVAGFSCGKVRMMNDDRGKALREAYPSTPVSISGLSPMPQAGDVFRVVENEKVARQIAEERRLAQRDARLRPTARTSLQDLYQQIQSGELNQLNLVLKADAQGSADAIAKSLVSFEHPEVKVNLLHSAIGDVIESDVLLAAASKGIIIGFQVGVDPQARRSAADEKVEIRLYKVIYDVLEDVRQALIGLLPTQTEEATLGEAEVKALFRSSRAGTVAGCVVISGKMVRGAEIRVRREGDLIYTGKLNSLRHVKEDVEEMESGRECGISITDFNDFQVGDLIEAFEIREIRRQVL
ncbi:MAG: translation initiation factor IF-2 [Armatimonadetes bacterium]|nr:translation initiation factor IF-2 [Armatimonadota bacterium]NIM23748.1 translation initiation factor IF-2 [Armatimonadota bacterium]NIM67625.1 translation initiation factor IF-2 [Armatimonadota bacterium]NIM76144.1 translation initiation factor IF-2 [Armatimonadota bacterium]NIN06827.1 translation initiation factor IF-2 [Armatimonadota bacterium]